MAGFTLYHNPRCSKSRQTLALLESHGVTPKVVLYLETPPDAKALKTLVKRLGLSRAHDLLRNKEAEYALAGLKADSKDDDVIAAMVKYPKLIERPIVISGSRAVIGRPPENVLTLINAAE
jgi:arsenate reductase